MQNKKSTILVLDANQRSALAITRSLGRHTHLRVITADETTTSLAGHSRYSAAYAQHPSLYREPDAFANWLIEFIKAEKIDWVFPATEVSSQTVLQLGDRLGNCRIPFAPYETVMALADKWRLVNLAEKCAVAYPASRHFSSSAEVDVRQIERYPIVIKPCLSRIRTVQGWLNTSVHIADHAEQLTTLLAEKPYLREHSFMLQEFIPGHGAGIFALYDRGRPITFFAHQRLREKPPSGGVSTLSTSVTPNPIMQTMAKKLLDAAGWHGVAMVEFRVSGEGKAYLMEVNTRFWGSLQLAIDAGVDFPYLLYRIGNGENPDVVDRYAVGRRLRWLLGDVDNLLLTLRDRSYSTAQKLLRLAQFFIPHPFSTRHEIDRWDDLAPAWFELKKYIKDLLR